MPFETIDQGILALREQAQQACSPEEGSVYIPLMGKYFSASEAATDLDAMIQAFTVPTNPNKTCVLLGDGGSGKSFFLQQLTLKLWNEYEPQKPIPLFVSLPLLKDPIHSAVEETLLKIGFDRVQINELKRHHSFVFIFDGYDEIHQLQNLYVSNRLSDLNAKTIMSCRSQYLYNKDHPNLYFMPIENEREQPHLLQTLYVAPFNETQIEEYLAIMLSRGTKITDYAKMVAIPGLYTLITTPFLLTLAIEALPEILERYANASEVPEECHRLTQTDLYKSFVRRWFERQEEKLKKSGHITENMPDQKPIFWRYCQALALEMHQHNASWLRADDERFSDYFDNDPETEMLRSACPIKKTEDKIGFWHQSLGMHFVAQTIYKESLTENSTQELSLSTTLDSTAVENSEQQRPKGTIHLCLISNDPAALRHLANEVDRDPRYKSSLFDIIEQSKTNKYYAIGAANAISILNMAKVSFSGMDLSYIRIPYANLENAMMDFTNLSESNLSEVSFRSAWLGNANFEKAIMNDIDWGEYPYLTHGSRVNSVCFSSEGNYFLSGGDDSVIKFWDWKTGNCLKVLAGHVSTVNSLDFSSDGNSCISGSSDETIKIWDLLMGKCISTIQGHIGGVNSVSFSSNDHFFISGGKDGMVKVWSTSTKECFKEFEGHIQSVNCVKFSSDNNFCLSTGWDNTVRIWNITSGVCQKILAGQERPKTTPLLDLRTGKWIEETISSSIESASFSSDARLCIFADHPNRGVKIWNATTGEYLKTLEDSSNGIATTSVQFNSDDKFCIACMGSTIKIWDATNGKCIKILEGHNGSVRSVRFSADNKYCISGSEDGSIKIWDLKGLFDRFKTQPPLIRGGIINMAVSHDGRLCLSTGWDNILLWEIKTGELLREFSGHVGFINSKASFSLDDKLCISDGGDDFTIRIWDVKTGQCLKILRGHTDQVRNVELSSDNQFCVSGSKDGTIRVWDIENEKCINIFQCPGTIALGQSVSFTSPVCAVKLTLDGFHCISASENNSIQIWDLCSDQCRKMGDPLAFNRLGDDLINTSRCEISPNGKFCASIGEELMFVWNIETGKQRVIGDLKRILGGVCCLHFSHDNKFLAIGNQDHTIWILDLEEASARVLRGHTGRMCSVQFSPDGKLLISGSDDLTIRLWNIENSECLTITNLLSRARKINFSPCGSWIVIGSDRDVSGWRSLMVENTFKINLYWTSSLNRLVIMNANANQAIGLSEMNSILLIQEGTLNVPNLKQLSSYQSRNPRSANDILYFSESFLKQSLAELEKTEKSELGVQSEIIRLIEKYKLKNTSQPELEKGLRNAAVNNCREDLKIFASNVHNINAQDNNPKMRRTALHWAVIRQHREVAEILVRCGARNDIKDAEGKTALDHFSFILESQMQTGSSNFPPDKSQSVGGVSSQSAENLVQNGRISEDDIENNVVPQMVPALMQHGIFSDTSQTPSAGTTIIYQTVVQQTPLPESKPKTKSSQCTIC